MKGNQLRLYLSALAYTLVEALRRLALKGTEWAEAQVDTIRLKLFKIGALVRISARRVWLELSSTYPWKQIYARGLRRAALLKLDRLEPNNLFPHRPAIGPAELCRKSDFDPAIVPSAQPARPTRQDDSTP